MDTSIEDWQVLKSTSSYVDIFLMKLGLHLGNLKIQNWWTGPDVICIKCRKPVNQWNGIICGNYLSRQANSRHVAKDGTGSAMKLTQKISFLVII